MRSGVANRSSQYLRYAGLAFFALTVLYGIAVHFTNPVVPEDDGFITYRYVGNLLSGRGLVYNPGEHVFGASNPLYLFWLALVGSESRAIPIPNLAVRLNFLFWLAAAVGMMFLLRRLVRSSALSALIAGLLFMRNDLLYGSLGGMESFLFLALLVWSVWALSARRFTLSALLAGLSVMARPEGVLLAGVVLLAWLVSSRRRPLPFLAALLVPAVAWAVFATAYFGSPIYQSIIAKARPLYPLPPGHALVGITRHLEVWATSSIVPYWSRIGSLLLPVRTIVTLLVLALAGIGFGLRHRLLGLRRSAALPVLVLFILLVLFYFITNPLMFDWYYPVLEVLWFLVLIPGVVWLASGLKHRVPWLGSVLTGLLLVFLAGSALPPPLTRLFRGERMTDLGIEGDEVRMRIVAYQEAAEWLNETVPETWTVAGPEIGSLGFFFRGRILDACALVSPEATRFLPVPAAERNSPEAGAISLELVQAEQPDAVATMPGFAYRSLYDDEWFQTNYVPVRQFNLPYELWGSKTVDVFFRRDHIRVEEP
jgi:hypothetical protein